MRMVIAFRSFFAAIFRPAAAERIARVLDDGASPQPRVQEDAPRQLPPSGPTRNDALTLLSSLQREARFIDFIKESLEGASDEQIGAVVRDVHRDCGSVLERLFAIRQLIEQDEGSAVEVPADFDAARFRLTGNVEGKPPFHGKLGHHGWRATRVEMPRWSGSGDSALVISPADVELSS